MVRLGSLRHLGHVVTALCHGGSALMMLAFPRLNFDAHNDLAAARRIG
jgi:hypothetical protein